MSYPKFDEEGLLVFHCEHTSDTIWGKSSPCGFVALSKKMLYWHFEHHLKEGEKLFDKLVYRIERISES